MLEEYKGFLAALAGIITLSQMFSGLFICRDIYRVGSTKDFPSMTFVGGCVISVLFMEHGHLLKDNTMGIVNFLGLGINVGYMLFFAAWSSSEERKLLLKQLGVAVAVLAALLGYVQIENPEVVAVRFGVIVTAMLLFLISAPLFSIKTIIKTKNTDCIPFPMVVSGLACGISWLLYGIAANQYFIVYQNLVMMSLTFPQLILCLMYPSNRKAKTS